MNKIAIALIATTCAACVDKDTAVSFARRAHPDCEKYHALSHRYSGTSQTEVSMECKGTTRSITIKCVFGWGLISDTTCHENN